MDDNNLLMIIMAFVFGFMLQGMMKNMCGGRLVEFSSKPGPDKNGPRTEYTCTIPFEEPNRNAPTKCEEYYSKNKSGSHVQSIKSVKANAYNEAGSGKHSGRCDIITDGTCDPCFMNESTETFFNQCDNMSRGNYDIPKQYRMPHDDMKAFVNN